MAVQRGTNVTITVPSGFTNISNEPNTATYNTLMGSQDYVIVAATTAQNPDWGNFGAVSPWAACIATFKGASASTTYQPSGGQAQFFVTDTVLQN
jgi:hypothetical protein